MAQEEATSVTAPNESVSARILAEIRQRLQQAGEPVTISGAKLAATLDIPVNAFRASLKELFDQGLLIKLSSGLAGTRIAAPSAAQPEDTGPAVPEARTGDRREPAQPAEMRAQILDYIRHTVQAEGGQVTLTTQQIAKTIGCSLATATNHVKALADIGHIVTERAGRAGTHFTLKERGARRVAAAKEAPRPKPTARRTYCPWCGAGVDHPDWKYCHGCGERLTR